MSGGGAYEPMRCCQTILIAVRAGQRHRVRKRVQSGTEGREPECQGVGKPQPLCFRRRIVTPCRSAAADRPCAASCLLRIFFISASSDFLLAARCRPGCASSQSAAHQQLSQAPAQTRPAVCNCLQLAPPPQPALASVRRAAFARRARAPRRATATAGSLSAAAASCCRPASTAARHPVRTRSPIHPHPGAPSPRAAWTGARRWAPWRRGS